MVRILSALLILLAAVPASGVGFAKVGTYGFMWVDMYTGTRQTALGQADMAGAHGQSAILINTAPLPQGNGVEVEYSRNDYVADIDLEVWGLTAEWDGFRVGFSRTSFSLDPQIVRTAYNPEGTGETFDASDGMNVWSLGYDFGRLLDPDGRWHWTVGAAYRDFRSEFAESTVEEHTWDLGTGFGWETDHAQGRTRLMGALSYHNLFHEDYVFDERTALLPRSLKAGLTLESTFGRMDWGAEALRVLMAFGYTNRPGDGMRDYDHYGLEVTGAGLVAFRLGHNSRWPGDFNSWGAGVILDRDFMGPVTVTADYGEYDVGFDSTGMWSVRVRCSF